MTSEHPRQRSGSPSQSSGRGRQHSAGRALLGLALLLGLSGPAPTAWALIPPIKVDIVDAGQLKLGQAQIYPNYIELEDAGGVSKGAVGVVMSQGRVQLFLVNAAQEHSLIGWAENHRLYNTKNTLVGYYYWTPIWSYVYDPKMKKVGQAQCLAYQGVCAAGVAGFLLGLL